MIKIAITVRNRLAMTAHCIEALKRNSKIPHQIYIYNNLTHYKVEEHFDYFKKIWVDKKIDQITFNSKISTFNAFSKASSLNSFGLLHEQDPNKHSYDFLLFLDNDALVMPGWDETLLKAWKVIKDRKNNNIKVIGQAQNGGIKNTVVIKDTLNGIPYILGKLGGSYFWSVKPDFFKDVGLLDLAKLVGRNKAHDINYWQLIEKKTNGQPYIIGIQDKLVLDCGGYVGSICNVIAKGIDSEKLEKIKYENTENEISKMTFEEFYNKMLERHDFSIKK